MQAYYQEAFEDGPCASQGFKSMYQHLQVRSQGEELIISGPSSVDTEHHRKNHLPNLASQLTKFGFPRFQCRVEADDQLTEELHQAFEAEKDQTSKQLMKKPCGASGVLVSKWPHHQ